MTDEKPGGGSVGFVELVRTAGGLTTDDVLASLLPLFKQVEATHLAGRVAPLDGADALHVDAYRRVYFEDAAAHEPRLAESRLREVERQTTHTLDVVGQRVQTTDADAGDEHQHDLLVAAASDAQGRAVYVPGYRSWEHLLEHHDALTDIYVLGLALASLACGFDFTNKAHVEAFARHRRNLFAVSPQINPVIAKNVVRLTELDRHRRAQDLAAVIQSLERYRDQDVGLELDLAQIPGFHDSDLKGRRRMLLARLRERLFEISRRNRLLYYKPTLQTVNLTFASIPILFDVRSIRPEQIFTWQPDVERLLADGKPISLNRYLRFEDAPYLPNVLDKVMAEARRDTAEFGFSQLRLVICFLRWNNLKEHAQERIDSPLLLLPIELTKRKAVRDSYVLTATSGEAEVNPVLRYYLKQQYNINLPFSIDLTETTITAFYDMLVAQIQASEPGVTLNRLDKPQVELVYARARRRLDQYRRRLRIGGTFKTFGQFDYSYSRDNYQPLGLGLFSRVVRPSPAPLQEIFRDRPVHEAHMTGMPSPPPARPGEKQKTMVAFREGGSDGNPYVWDFDLCNLTLGNFNYRKMSLIRDYNMLLEADRPSQTFDAVFPLMPRPVEPVGSADAGALARCYPVVPCDPTQLRAVGAAQAGRSYIVQGPPGTGKSQTITNLIADLVAQGKRILFVCEKRAAIDVVYHRLQQRGLHDLVCLIHDSQADKREFIQDLKSTYERLLAGVDRAPSAASRRRAACVAALEREQQPIAAFDEVMRSVHEDAGIPTRELIVRALELGRRAATDRKENDLPPYRLWIAHREALDRLARAVRHASPDGIYANHPLHTLSPAAAARERPGAALADDLDATTRLLDRIESIAREHGVTVAAEHTISDAEAWVQYAAVVAPLADRGGLELLQPESAISQRLRERLAAVQSRRDALDRARQATRAWRRKLEADDLERALEQARALSTYPLRWVTPGFWRLRGILVDRYDFASHAVKPAWTRVLENLKAEYDAAAALEADQRAAGKDFAASEDFVAFAEKVQAVRAAAQDLLRTSAPVAQMWQKAADPARAVVGLLAARDHLAGLRDVLSRFLPESAWSFGDLRRACVRLREALPRFADWLPCLVAAGELPEALARVIRTRPLRLPQLEAAMASRTLEEIWRREHAVARFDAGQKGIHAGRLERLYSQWLAINAEAVLEQHRERFLARVALASTPSIRLTKEQDELKRSYNAGRRELEHEFGKTMRYKSVRGLLHGAGGEVVLGLKPVWLMSPLSVSDTLPIDERIFDVAIFDEARQVPLEEAVPVLFRAEQVIVSGDQMQLPPTNFFSATRTGEETVLIEDDEEQGAPFEYELDSNSFLAHAARNLPSTLLGWHYRSRSESLISFSNAAFYEGRLLTVPEREPPPPGLEPIRVAAVGQGDENVARVMDRPVSFHFLETGRYEARRNLEEAAYIARLVRGLLARTERPTIGIVAFSEAQQTAIETALERLAATDPVFAGRLEEEYEREEEGQFSGLLVKNLENIQGDERDVIILSVCYGYGPDGRMLMNFGPINQTGGERRLNVAFSRAKRHMVVVSSIQSTDIRNVYNDGANSLRNYLQYTAAMSAGDLRSAHAVLRSFTLRDAARTTDTAPDVVIEQLAAALRDRGLEVVERLGQSRFRCDLAVRPSGEAGFRVAVFIDGEREGEGGRDIVEREVLKPGLLRSFGWSVRHVLAKDWYEDPDAVLASIDRCLAGEDDEDDEDIEALMDLADAPAIDERVAPEADVAGAAPSPVPAAPPPPAALPLSALPPGATRYFEFIEGGSRKYWHVTVDASELVVSFGRIGTQGQVKRKAFPSADGARREAERLIREKIGKGYREKS